MKPFRCALRSKIPTRLKPGALCRSRGGPLTLVRGYRGSSQYQYNAWRPRRIGQIDKKLPAAQNDRKSGAGERSIKDLLSLNGRVTVVTGGGRGIGLSLARAAAELGSDVAVLDILEKPHNDLLNIANDFGVRIEYYRTNVTDFESLTRAFDQTVQDLGRIDNCVTAAGIVLDKSFLDTTWEESARILEVNILGSYFAAQLAARRIRDQKTNGSIVLIASISARAALPTQNLSIYGASKGAITGLCQQLAVELGPLGIRVNSVSPGFIATEMTQGLAVTNPEIISAFNSATPLHRVGERQDLKTVVGYLLSDAAAFTTGSDILVTGGLHSGHL